MTMEGTDNGWTTVGDVYVFFRAEMAGARLNERKEATLSFRSGSNGKFKEKSAGDSAAAELESNLFAAARLLRSMQEPIHFIIILFF